MEDHGITVDDVYYCPYLNDAKRPEYRRDSDLRKPSPGMLHRARDDHEVNLADSYMIGDKVSDVKAGQRAGCSTVLVRTGKSKGITPESLDVRPDFVIDNISQVTDIVPANDPDAVD